jgi:hypothetical protein
MKLVKRKGETWQYELNQVELDLLKQLLKNFPFTGNVPVKISKADADPKSIEWEKLLNESLAEHRKELKKQASNLIAVGKFHSSEKGHLLTLNAEEREILLQILNDIRVGCWHVLGEPESLELHKPECSAQDIARHRLMDLAGYFEHHLIGLTERETGRH